MTEEAQVGHKSPLVPLYKRGKETSPFLKELALSLPKGRVRGIIRGQRRGGKMTEQSSENTKEIEIQGDSPRRFYQIITSVANELYFKDCFFEARLATSKETDNYAPFDILVIDKGSGSKTPVGFLTLQSVGNNRIMLRVPPRSRWHHDGTLSPIELMRMGYSKYQYDEHFNQFIKSLEDRLAHYGLKITLPERLWRWVELHKVLSILAAIASIATIIGVILTYLNYFR